MSSERTNCTECGRFAEIGQTLCSFCREVESLKRKLDECKTKLGKYVGPSGQRWTVIILEQQFSFKNHSDAQTFAKDIITHGLWYLKLRVE